MSDTDIRFAKLVQIIERMAKVIEKEVPETQLMAAMGLLLTVANSHDEERLPGGHRYAEKSACLS
jgi:hypothetical protein